LVRFGWHHWPGSDHRRLEKRPAALGLLLGGPGGAVPGTGLTINKFLSFYSKFRKHLHKVEVVSGVILILIGVLVMSNRVTLLSSSWLASVMPNLESKLKLRGGAPTPDPQKTSYTPAPDVQFTKLDGSPFRLQELRGRVVMLNFWATWCVPAARKFLRSARCRKILKRRA
jgi:thiol:disulfide interchange protein